MSQCNGTDGVRRERPVKEEEEKKNLKKKVCRRAERIRRRQKQRARRKVPKSQYNVLLLVRLHLHEDNLPLWL